MKKCEEGILFFLQTHIMINLLYIKELVRYHRGCGNVFHKVDR